MGFERLEVIDAVTAAAAAVSSSSCGAAISSSFTSGEPASISKSGNSGSNTSPDVSRTGHAATVKGPAKLAYTERSKLNYFLARKCIFFYSRLFSVRSTST